MLIYDFTFIDAPAGVVRSRLLDGSNAWLGELAGDAAAEGDSIRLRLGPHGGHRILAKDIDVHVGQPFARGASTVVPVTWTARGAAPLFPIFSGDIEIAAIGGAETQLLISGKYDPPLGALGEALDRFALHRIAQASIRAFLVELGRALAAHREGALRS